MSKHIKSESIYLTWGGSEWAHVFICEETRSVAILSSYGTYGFHWGSARVPGSIKDHLIAASCASLTRKLISDLPGTSRRVVDENATEKECRDYVLEHHGLIYVDMSSSTMQSCDSTCWHCAHAFFKWWRHRAFLNNRSGGRSGAGSFAENQTNSRQKRVDDTSALRYSRCNE